MLVTDVAQRTAIIAKIANENWKNYNLLVANINSCPSAATSYLGWSFARNRMDVDWDGMGYGLFYHMDLR
jgi:hypothetical protein